ncbi:MAG: FIST C-terminal domain-containing protein [Acidiferrobacterales bacterium]|nr:FIST C-terminal domain-containing protein [Acidiferrobacterales bacterium]
MINPTHQITKTVVATGHSYGALPNDEHARIAVSNALKKMQPCSVGSVLLFLTCGYANKPQGAITEAAKAAGTTQIFGCCAMSLMTEEEWLLDVEGAVAMVFPQELSLHPLQLLKQQGITPKKVLTLTTPNAATISVNNCDIPQVGSITTDEFGHGPFSVWQCGRIIENEFAQIAFKPDTQAIIKTSESIRQISPIMQVTQADKHRLITVDDKNALDNLLDSLPENFRSLGLTQPYNLLCAISENTDIGSIKNGHYKIQHIVANDEQQRHIHLSGSVKEGRHIFWGLRDEKAAEQEMQTQLEHCQQSLQQDQRPPLFGLMFPNIGRGPEFYNGRDRDFDYFRAHFPELPMIGFYGNGEIAPGHQFAGLIHRYATVFSIFFKIAKQGE